MPQRLYAVRSCNFEVSRSEHVHLNCSAASFAGRRPLTARSLTASFVTSSGNSRRRSNTASSSRSSNSCSSSSSSSSSHCVARPASFIPASAADRLLPQQQQQQHRRRLTLPPPPAAAAAAAAAAVMADNSSSSSSSSSPRVLSIQSSVVHGYVGNKSAVFPLQLLGFDVDPAYTVQFSNHTGYPSVKGHVFDGAHLLQILDGLTANGLICHSHLLTGYIGSLSLLEAVATLATKLKEHHPGLTYVCDPVLGDEGKLYVSQELITAYTELLLPLANIITPNQFEAECLTGLTVGNEEDALVAAAALHDKGPHTVVITSMSPLPHPEYSPPPPSGDMSQQQQQQEEKQQQQEQYITLIASTRVPQAEGSPSTFRLRIPQLPGYFTGTGDLLCALLLAWTHRHPDSLATAVEKAVAGLQGILELTAAAGPEVLASLSHSSAVFRAKELKLIQGQHLLANPVVKIRAELVVK